MTRLAFAMLVTVVALLALVSLSEHARGDAPPLVHAAAPVLAPRLFAPCPLSPRNFPIPEQRKA